MIGEIMRKYVLGFIIGVIVTLCVNTFANTIFDGVVVSYNKYNSETNVQDAIDDLYDRSSYGDAAAGNILSGKTALINGSKVTGTMTNLSNTIQTATTSTADRTKSAYKWESGIVIAPGNGYWGNWDWGQSAIKVPAADFGGAAASSVLSGQTFTSSNGMKITGTMANNGAINGTVSVGSTYTIPAGYTSGGSIRATGSGLDFIPIAKGKTAYNNTTFDVTSSLSNYSSLTADDFVVLARGMTNPTVVAGTGPTTMTKTYDASTGKLTIGKMGGLPTGGTQAAATPTFDILFIKGFSQKAKLISSGVTAYHQTTVDVRSSISNYANASMGDFLLVLTGNSTTPTQVADTASKSTTLSYNKSTGILTIGAFGGTSGGTRACATAKFDVYYYEGFNISSYIYKG